MKRPTLWLRQTKSADRKIILTFHSSFKGLWQRTEQVGWSPGQGWYGGTPWEESWPQGRIWPARPWRCGGGTWIRPNQISEFSTQNWDRWREPPLLLCGGWFSLALVQGHQLKLRILIWKKWTRAWAEIDCSVTTRKTTQIHSLVLQLVDILPGGSQIFRPPQYYFIIF